MHRRTVTGILILLLATSTSRGEVVTTGTITPLQRVASTPKGHTSRGLAHYEKAEFERAIADFTKAIEMNPRSAVAHCNLGWSCEAIGDERQAIAHYRKALKLDPSLEAARDNLKLLGTTPERPPFHRQARSKGS